MKQNIIMMIEKSISYEFRNKKLLEQAFTRITYAKEHPGRLDNEMLEFIGDSVLMNSIVKRLVYEYTEETDNGLVAYKNEKELTELKIKLVQKSMLAKKMDELGLMEFLELGKGDKELGVMNQPSVKEDLFEAIIGAVAIDSDFDEETIEDLIDIMLDPDQYIENDFEETEDNYIGMLQEWCQNNGYGLPDYNFTDQWENPPLNVKWQYGEKYRDHIYHWRFSIEIEDKVFSAEADSKKEAKMELAKQVIEYLKENDIYYDLEDIVGEPTLDRAVNQLQELYQKKWIKAPNYIFEEVYHSGTYQWKVECHVEGYEYYFYAISASKKEAKKQAALEMLEYIRQEGFK